MKISDWHCSLEFFFSLFFPFLGREWLTALIKSLKLGEKNLTLTLLSYQLLGVKLLRVSYIPPCWDDTAGDLHGDSRVTLTSDVHFGMWVGRGIDTPSWIWLDKKCPRVSVAICSVAPGSLLLASWTNPALTQREICHFLYHQNSFLPQIGVPQRSPMKFLIQIGLA